MQKTLIILVFIVLGVGCKHPSDKSEIPLKKILFKAVHESGDWIESRHELTIFSDSTFVYDSKEKDHGHSKYEKFQGVVRIQNDTLYFSRKDMNGAGDQAVIKNDMLEFFNEAKMFRLAVTQNHTSLKSALDLSAHSDYALFSYYPSKKNDYNKPYDLSQAEFDVVRSLIACVFEENKDLRNPEAEFIKQLIPYRNRKGAIEVRVYLHSKNKLDPNGFKYHPIIGNNASICSISFVVSLTTNYYADLSVSMACK